MGEPEWLTDPRFATDDDRGRHAEIISERMGRWCADRAADDIVQILGDAMIPCAPVLKPQEALDHPQVRALGVLQNTDYPGLPRPAPVAAVPLWMSETHAVPRVRPPQLGEHTNEVLSELGYSAQDIAGMRERSVI
jgi:crotonobetainyl-CoA:carnitine CoA-transferase CaiB-like acyl-CoA transferase